MAAPSLFDEIGELAGSLQAKLLRVLEDGHMRRVGSIKERRVSVRLIAATNRDMLQEMEQGRFREDLYYRVNVLTIFLPRLFEREGDIRLLLNYFLGHEWQVDDDAERVILNYSWPGNVRQLCNALERAKILADDERIRACNLPPEIVRGAEQVTHLARSNLDLDTVTRLHIQETFDRCDKNKSRTAKALGIGRRTLYRLLEKYGIEPSPVSA
jgi:transcriptional regulator with PAS, ATPase and Fis domain